MPRNVTLTDSAHANLSPEPCPKCGNSKKFKAFSQQCAEDACDIWVECWVCGYDPTFEKCGWRFEDVWGGTHDGNVVAAISCWDDAIRDLQNPAN